MGVLRVIIVVVAPQLDLVDIYDAKPNDWIIGILNDLYDARTDTD